MSRPDGAAAPAPVVGENTTEPAQIPGPVWSAQEPLGYGAGLAGFGAVAAPLLAGFALTGVIELSGRANLGGRGTLAMLGFTYAAAILLVAVQSALAATSWQVPPAERLAWFPEAQVDPNWLTWVRARQWRDDAVAEVYRRRVRWTYNSGIVALLCALTALLVPGPGQWTLGRVMAMVVVAAAAATEIVIMFNIGPMRLRDLLMPGAGALAGRPPKLFKPQAQTMPEMDTATLERLLRDPGRR